MNVQEGQRHCGLRKRMKSIPKLNGRLCEASKVNHALVLPPIARTCCYEDILSTGIKNGSQTVKKHIIAVP